MSQKSPFHPKSANELDDIETNDVKSALKNQIPLKQIFENLKNNEYQTPQQLINEINKLITNYEKSSNTPEYYFYQIMAVEFHRIFQKEYGMSPTAYRNQRALEALESDPTETTD